MPAKIVDDEQTRDYESFDSIEDEKINGIEEYDTDDN